MKVFREIYFSVKDLNDQQVFDLFDSLCRSFEGFELKKEKSNQYANDTNGRAFIIYALKIPTTEPAVVAIAEKTKRTLYVANIVPMEKSELSMDEYNYIASNFYGVFKQHLGKIHSKASVRITKDNVGLKQLIPGKLTRKYFERYLSEGKR